MLCVIIVVPSQGRPAELTDTILATADSFLFHHTKTTVAARFHMLSKPQLTMYLSTEVPRKVGGLPPQCSQPLLAQVCEVMGDDYYT